MAAKTKATISLGNTPGGKVEVSLSQQSHANIVEYVKTIIENDPIRNELRHSLERVDREYARESNRGKDHADAEAANFAGDKDEIKDATIPIVGPQTEAALTYLAGVFLTGYPIFSFVSAPEFAPQAKQMTAIIEENSIRTGWTRNLLLAHRDGLKYNRQAVEVTWARRTSYSFFTDPTQISNTQNGVKNKEVVWEGNEIKRLDMYNTFFDPRVPIAKIHEEGEFAGYIEIMSRIRLKQFIQDMPNAINIRDAFECGPISNGIYYVPQITDKTQFNPGNTGQFDWGKWFTVGHMGTKNSDIDYRDKYEVTTLYARILPKDFEMSVPAAKTPQIWKFIIVNSQVCILAERCTNAHNYLPIIFGQPLEDGLNLQTLSFAENLVDSQDMASALWKIKMNSARRMVTDRMVYDVTKIRPEDINSSSPNAKIPARPSGYGGAISNTVYQIPYRDDVSAQVVNDVMSIVEFSRSISGINRVQEGQFQKGNRTLSEFQTVDQNSNARLQLLAMFQEAQFYTPIKEIIKTNILQYQQSTQIYSRAQSQNITINPIELRQAALEFKISDGLLPTSKIANTDFVQTLLQMVLTSPTIAQQFDAGKLVAYLASLQNVPDISAFLVQQNPVMPSPNSGNPNAPSNTGVPANPTNQAANAGNSGQPPTA